MFVLSIATFTFTFTFIHSFVRSFVRSFIRPFLILYHFLPFPLFSSLRRFIFLVIRCDVRFIIGSSSNLNDIYFALFLTDPRLSKN